jgi:outer membrane lipoprotein-sorting protein
MHGIDNMIRPLFWLVALWLMAAETAFPAQSDPLLTSWLKAQANIKSWSADFVQTKHLKALTQPLTATGHVWFAAPNRFHWELGKPPESIAVRAPEALLLVYPKLKRVERFPLTGNQLGHWRDALGLLEAGFPRSQTELESRFNILGQIVTDNICELNLQPKSADARKLMPRMKIAFDTKDHSLRATELEFADGSTMRDEFSNPMINPKVDDKLFAPDIPADFKVIEPLKRR